MLELYLLCGIVGLGWTVVNLVLGHAVDGDGGGHEVHVSGAFDAGGEAGIGEAIGETGGGHLALPLFSPTAIAGYLTGFGATGYGLVGGLGVTSPLVHVPASLFGAALLGVGVSWATLALLRAGETTSAPALRELVGRAAEVTVAIPEGGVGEVTFLGGGVRRAAPARSRSGAAVPGGARVRIHLISDATYVVEPEDEVALAPVLGTPTRD